MKKLLLIFFLAGATGANAQWINGLSVSPANPTTADSVFVYVDCSFTAGPCPPWTQNQNIAGFNINGGALHCVGMLTFICPYTDTFALGTLPVGTYTFHFQLNEGHGGPPCTPGIVAGPTDSIAFTVTFPTFVQQHSADGIFSFFPSPAEEKITVINKTQQQVPVRIFDVAGKIVVEKILSDGSEEMYVGDLKPGIYFLENRNSRFKFVKQ